MSCSDCMNRREFLVSAGGLAALAGISACGDGTVTGGNAPRPSQQIVIKVGDFPQLANEGTLVVVAPSIAAKRTGADTFDAYYMVCTHAGCLTILTAQQQFFCDCHGSRFDANGGVVNGPANRPLTKLAAAYNAAADELTIS